MSFKVKNNTDINFTVITFDIIYRDKNSIILDKSILRDGVRPRDINIITKAIDKCSEHTSVEVVSPASAYYVDGDFVFDKEKKKKLDSLRIVSGSRIPEISLNSKDGEIKLGTNATPTHSASSSATASIPNTIKVEDKLSVDEGLCSGGFITATKMGLDARKLSPVALQNIKKIAEKWGDLDRQYGSKANACLKPGPTSITHDCLDKAMPDNKLYGFYKGTFLASNALTQKPLSVIEYEVNSICVIVY